jgi:phenylacetate-CoA ligase
MLPLSSLAQRPADITQLLALPSFLSLLRQVEMVACQRFEAMPTADQQTVMVQRLAQLVAICRLNPLWRERIDAALPEGQVFTLADFEAIPLTDKETFRIMFTGDRPGMVVPINANGFMIVASGGTSSGMPSETVYPLDELQDTYRWAGDFMGRHITDRHLPGPGAKWFATTLADYQMWSSGTMVGGVLQSIPGVNYIGAGTMSRDVFQHMMSYPGSKGLMGITGSIALLPSFAEGLSSEARASLHIAMFGSGTLSEMVRADLVAAYPNVKVLSYFAATQAETIGLQLDPDKHVLTVVPGLHLVEIVDENNRSVAVGEEGELVVTRLFGNAAPCLRYKVGDRVRRLADREGKGLNAMQFTFVGRSGDFMHLGDTQYSAERARTALVDEFKRRKIIDLDAIAIDLQLKVERSARTFTLIISCNQPELHTKILTAALDSEGSQPVIMAALARSLSIFNGLEANEASLVRSGFRFGTRIVAHNSPELHRTPVGKVPLLVDLIL